MENCGWTGIAAFASAAGAIATFLIALIAAWQLQNARIETRKDRALHYLQELRRALRDLEWRVSEEHVDFGVGYIRGSILADAHHVFDILEEMAAAYDNGIADHAIMDSGIKPHLPMLNKHLQAIPQGKAVFELSTRYISERLNSD